MNDAAGDMEIVKKAPARKAKPKAKTRVAAAKVPPVVHAEPNVRRAAPRPPTRSEGARDVARETPREGAVIAVGRDGEKLTRRRIAVGDPMDVPLNEIPRGWSYQWNPVTVLNKGVNEILQSDLGMHQNGWRPVPAARHPGRWTPPGFEGGIVVDGLRLEERPLSLTKEAQAEDELRAKSLVRDRTDALRMTQKQLPGAREAAARNNAGGFRMEIDPALDIPRPGHVIDDGSFDD